MANPGTRHGGKPILRQLQILYNKVLFEGTTPETWKNAVVILHKKGDTADCTNYRLISLLSNICKLFTKIITLRLASRFATAQPVGQAGFRSGFSTLDHIHNVKKIIEKCNEYNQPLVLAFVDYEKAFDSIEHWAVFHSLQRTLVDMRNVELLREIYSKSTLQVKLHELTEHIPVKRDVRQGDT